MSSISTLLQQILTAVYGREVRQSIHDAIEQCYSDVGDPILNEAAFNKAVQAKIDDGSIAALTLGEGSIETKFIKDKAVTLEKIADDVIAKINSSDIFEKSETIKNINIYTDVEWTDGLLIFGGNEIANASYSSTGYIPIETTAYYECNDGNGASIYCYGDGYKKLGEISVPATTGKIELKNGTKYIRSYITVGEYKKRTSKLLIPTTVSVYDVANEINKEFVLDTRLKKIENKYLTRKDNVSMLYAIANSVDIYDTSGKYDYVYTGEDSKMQHAASIMNINGTAACVFNLNTKAVSDATADGAEIHVLYNGTLINLKEETGVAIGGGRVVHGDKDYIICGGDYLVEYTVQGNDITWTARKFTNDTGLEINYMSQMVYKNGYFYSVPSTGTVTSSFVMLKYDIENMKITKVADVTLPEEVADYKSVFESCLFDFNGIIYIALRPDYKSCRGINCVGRILVGILDSLENPEMTDYIWLPDGSTRPLFFTNKNKSKLFVMTGANDRLTGWVFNVTDLQDWYAVFGMKYNVNYADSWIVNNKIYWCGAEIRNTVKECKVTFGEFKYEGSLGGIYD